MFNVYSQGSVCKGVEGADNYTELFDAGKKHVQEDNYGGGVRCFQVCATDIFDLSQVEECSPNAWKTQSPRQLLHNVFICEDGFKQHRKGGHVEG